MYNIDSEKIVWYLMRPCDILSLAGSNDPHCKKKMIEIDSLTKAIVCGTGESQKRTAEAC